jgi:hypothetical protein
MFILMHFNFGIDLIVCTVTHIIGLHVCVCVELEPGGHHNRSRSGCGKNSFGPCPKRGLVIQPV